MNDNAMHYCPGCSHGVVHKLIAEVIEEMGMEKIKPWESLRWDVQCLPTTISILTGRKQHTDVLLLWRLL